jgi:outer membrane protein
MLDSPMLTGPILFLSGLLIAPAAAAPNLLGSTQEPVLAPGSEAADVVPLRLEDLVLMVSQNAPAVRQARLSALIGEGSVTEAGGQFDPVFFADATWSTADQPPSGFLSTLFSEQSTTVLSGNQGIRGMLLSGATYNVSLREQQLSANYLPDNQSDVSLNFNFTQPLLRGGWELVNFQTVRTAEISREKGYESVRQAAVNTMQEAVDAYWDLAFAIEDSRVKEFGLEMAKEQKEVTQARFKVGSVAEVEVVQTEAEIASRTDALLTARNTVRQAQDRLRLLVYGLQDESEWAIDFLPISELPSPEGTAVQWQDALQVALETRSDLIKLQLDLAQAELDWKVASKNTDPKLDLILTANSYGQDIDVVGAFKPVSQFDFPGYSVGLVFELPLGNRQFAGAERRTRAQILLAQRTLRDTEHSVASEVRDAVRAINYLAERIEATALASRVAARQLEAEQRRLREGVSTNFKVLEFQNDLLTAQTAEHGARSGHAKAVTKLYTVQGLNWDGTRPGLPRHKDVEADAEEMEADMPR